MQGSPTLTNRIDDALWQQAPCAALRLWHESGLAHWQLNATAVEWSLRAGLKQPEWQGVADALLRAGPMPAGQVTAGEFGLRYQRAELETGWLLWLTPQVPAPAAQSGWRDASEKLALMQGFDRMGFFARGARGENDWWDPHMFRLLGLPPALEPPPFEQAVLFVHPDDRDRLASHHYRAMRNPGRYEIRYRLLLADGRQRDVQALTEVRAGESGKDFALLGVLIDDTDGADRVRAQQAVSAHLARALELAMISVWRVDLQRRRIHFNDIGYRLAGAEPTPEGLDLDVTRAQVHPDDLQRLTQATKQAMASHQVVDTETRHRNPDGSYRHLLTRRVAERDAQGRVVALAGVSLDQTAQIAERERSQALARRIQTVADATGVGIWSIENVGEGEAERVQWNAQMFLIYGLSGDRPAPPLGDWMGTRVHEADRQRVANERRAARKAGRAGFETEFRIVRPDGSLRWVVCRSHRELRDGSSFLHGIHIDVTRQRMLDQELRLHEQRLQLATRFAGVGSWERDLASGQLIWDEQMYRLRGLGPDDPRATVDIERETMQPDAYAQRMERLRRHLEDGQPFEFEFEVRWPDGSVHWLASTGRAVREPGLPTTRMLGLNWDITERKRAEAAQREAEAADRANRAKSEFLARMSHELRTPLNAILGFAQLMEHEAAGRLDAVQIERLTRIRSAGAHLLSLIEDVLDLTAVEAGAMQVDLQPTALDETVEEVREWVAPLAAEGGVSLRLQPSGAMVMADRRRLRQIVANLVTNALKYNHRGGWAQVSACRVAVDGHDGWELSVQDNGRGMSEAQQAHLFEPFNRLGAEREGIEGRGIGLSTVHQLVQLMGGRLQVRSQSGEGSDFRVWLPAAEDSGTSAPAGSLRMLYIEDSAVNTRVLEELVAMWPHVELQCAADGRSGVELALRESHDLVLVDMQLPDIDGHEMLRRLRTADCRATLVALSANALPAERRRALAAGFDDFWTKPLDFKQLMAGIERLTSKESRHG